MIRIYITIKLIKDYRFLNESFSQSQNQVIHFLRKKINIVFLIYMSKNQLLIITFTFITSII